MTTSYENNKTGTTEGNSRIKDYKTQEERA